MKKRVDVKYLGAVGCSRAPRRLSPAGRVPGNSPVSLDIIRNSCIRRFYLLKRVFELLLSCNIGQNVNSYNLRP